MPTTLTVTQVNTYLKSVLDGVPQLRNIYISGEISNFKHYQQSGHMYFTLKDATSQLKCVMFSYDNRMLKFRPENGMGVVCFGQVTVYERDGAYQLYVHDMQPQGIGSLQVAYEQLKQKLEKEGLFDDNFKKPIPDRPTKIGVATSNMGAAVEDIKNVISRRYPLAEIFIVPTVVQGDSASVDIVSSLELLDNIDVDVIIVGRGGGSIEDLWAFNTEEVARAVFKCKTPVISAVGHETDYTICDFVADLRAPTPSAAAELAVPNIENEIVNINNLAGFLDMLISRKIEQEEARLENLTSYSKLASAEDFIQGEQTKIEDIEKVILLGAKRKLELCESNISKLASVLNALSPLAILGRGFSISNINDKIITSIDDVEVGDNIDINIKDGKIKATVCEVEKL